MNCYERAQQFVGVVRELPGTANHPLIQWWLSLCGFGFDAADEIPWCSAFANGMAWDCKLPMTRSAAARSWLRIGTPIKLEEARAENDVVILKRGPPPQPGPETANAPGHVFFFGGLEDRANATGIYERYVLGIGGNQGNEVGIGSFRAEDVLGVRRLAA